MDFKPGDYAQCIKKTWRRYSDTDYVVGEVYIVTDIEPAHRNNSFDRIGTLSQTGFINGWIAENFINVGSCTDLEKIIYGFK